MELKDEREKTSLSLRPSLVIAAQRKMLDLGKRSNISDAVEAALIHWTSSDIRQSADSQVHTKHVTNTEAENEKWLEILKELLASGNHVITHAITSNLRAFRELLARVRRSPGKDAEDAIEHELRIALRAVRKAESIEAAGRKDQTSPPKSRKNPAKRRKIGGDNPDQDKAVGQ